ncbi:hypothetical protein CR532_03785 [Candidatus Borreliella tachyglossi]|uniref:Uncharacterized protein n=1 Tax=Candidatus Borreliella tachyglossi TaxID=1964448 RepID=A0A2S1LXP7_9SPIR|nr:hypothetical protein [Candidatus Borreliella tachyglossi]AWG43074.1 hypothetical protein CR532_03785 [Candidatus Borreliella tachyglossi]
MRNNILIFFLLVTFYSYAQVNQVLTEISPLSISSKSGKGSIYLRVSKSSNYILTFDSLMDSDFVYMIYDIVDKRYITDKVKKRDAKIKLDKERLYAVIYITSEDASINVSITDLDLSIISDNILKAKASNIKKEDKIFLLKDLPSLRLDFKLKKYILRIHKRNIYLAYQMEGSDNIKVSAFIENIGWFDINSAVNENVTDVVYFDFAINSKGELYVAFATKSTNNFFSELLVKKFNSRKWIDISPKLRDNIGGLVNISIDKRDNLYLAYLREAGSEYKINFIINKGYGNAWSSAIGSYISKGNANIDASNIGIISDPFLGIFYNYKIDNYVKSEFVIDKGKIWSNTNTQSANMANSVKILASSKSNQVILSYITKDRPVISISTLKCDEWRNISPNISINGINSDIVSYRGTLFLTFEDGNDIRLIYFDNNDWYFLNGSEIFGESVCKPQFGNYQNEGFVLSYFRLDLKVLFLRLVS